SGWIDRNCWDSWSIRPQEGTGACVPRPRKDSPASARTEIAKATEAWTMTMPAMFGSTWTTAMAGALRFDARAARTYTDPSTCRVPDLARRANPGIAAMPTATMAGPVPGE